MTPELAAAHAKIDKLEQAIRFCRDIAAEELPHAPVGSGAEVVLRHIRRKCEEMLNGRRSDR